MAHESFQIYFSIISKKEEYIKFELRHECIEELFEGKENQNAGN